MHATSGVKSFPIFSLASHIMLMLCAASMQLAHFAAREKPLAGGSLMRQLLRWLHQQVLTQLLRCRRSAQKLLSGMH